MPSQPCSRVPVCGLIWAVLQAAVCNNIQKLQRELEQERDILTHFDRRGTNNEERYKDMDQKDDDYYGRGMECEKDMSKMFDIIFNQIPNNRVLMPLRGPPLLIYLANACMY